jgi:hypothetical protein
VNLELSLDPSHRSPLAWKIPPLEVGPLEIKALSRKSVVVKEPSCAIITLGYLLMSVELGTLPLQLVCIVISKGCLVILNTLIDVLP